MTKKNDRAESLIQKANQAKGKISSATTAGAPAQVYSSGTMDPGDWELLVKVLETAEPGAFNLHEKGMKARLPDGSPSVVISLKTGKPTRVVTLYTKGTLSGVGIDVEPILQALLKLKTAPTT